METIIEFFRNFRFELRDEEKYYKIYIFDGDRQIGRLKGYIFDSNLNGAVIKALGIGALYVEPEYRRSGTARHAINMMTEFSIKNGCIVSYLHPFSFSYYRTMGYERVSDHRMIEFPIENLDCFTRNTNVTYLAESEQSVKLMNKVYNRFAQNRNLMFLRNEKHEYDFVHHSSYLTRDENGEPDGYVSVQRERMLVPDTHHEHGTVLRVSELCYTSPEALYKLFGYLRMYEGNMRSVRMLNIAMSPEVERVLRHYIDMEIQIQPDISAKILDAQKVLSAVKYPQEIGCFTVKITDESNHTLKSEIWKVEYENGASEVTRQNDDAPYDLACDLPSFSQLVHGYESFGEQSAKYMQGIELCGNCDDFFRAFYNRANGLYDLF